MSIWEQILVSQADVDCTENPFITDGSRSRLDMSDQLWSLFIAGLGEMDLIPHPQRGPFFAIACVEVIGRVDELSRGQGWLISPLPSLIPWFKLLFPNGVQSGDGRQHFHPVRGVRSLECIEQHPAIGS